MQTTLDADNLYEPNKEGAVIDGNGSNFVFAFIAFAMAGICLLRIRGVLRSGWSVWRLTRNSRKKEPYEYWSTVAVMWVVVGVFVMIGLAFVYAGLFHVLSPPRQ